MTNLPDPSTPIDEALEQLKLPEQSFVAVRTFGDLLVEVERGNVKNRDILKAIDALVVDEDLSAPLTDNPSMEKSATGYARKAKADATTVDE